MQINSNVSLAQHSTMRLGGTAAYAVDITNNTELVEALNWATAQNIPVHMIGSGSNIVWRDEGFAGLLLVNKISGFEVRDEGDDDVFLLIGAGENWDSVVARSVEAGLTGIEALSLIPGSSGATPVQNVGAYGQDIAQTLATLQAYDRTTHSFVVLPAMDCGFKYRSSRFKNTDSGRFFITSITLHLRRGNPLPPFYPALQSYLEQQECYNPTPNQIRQAVIAIRQAKLPDPAVIANNGSFFANPIINKTLIPQIQADTDATIPYWPTDTDGMVKVSAAWLVEHAGFADYHDADTGMATWPTQALVFVNESAQSTAALLTFKQKVIDAVRAKFNITLEQEPELLPRI